MDQPTNQTARRWRSANRAAWDFYPTPPEATKALLSVEDFSGSVWEPACGDGAIAKVLTDAGLKVTATDLINRGYGSAGIDFLTAPLTPATHIITNPPYGRGLADAFVRHALMFTRGTGGKVAMLLDLRSLCHPSRHDRWAKTPPAVVYALDELTCYPNGDSTKAGYKPGRQRFVWCVWKPDHQGPTQLRWLAATQFKDAPPASKSDEAQREPVA
jgi:hypothetical protein